MTFRRSMQRCTGPCRICRRLTWIQTSLSMCLKKLWIPGPLWQQLVWQATCGDCGPIVCPLVAWLRTFRGNKEINMICASPKEVQGEKVMDAVDANGVCKVAPAMLSTVIVPSTPFVAFAQTPASSFIPTLKSGDSRRGQGTAFEGTTSSASSQPAVPPPEQDFEPVSFHKIVAGSVALFLSVAMILLVIYVSWKRYPSSVKQLQENSAAARKRRKKSRETERTLSTPLQEYYVDYKPNNTEGTDVLVNGTGPCTYTISGSRECEVRLNKAYYPLDLVWNKVKLFLLLLRRSFTSCAVLMPFLMRLLLLDKVYVGGICFWQEYFRKDMFLAHYVICLTLDEVFIYNWIFIGYCIFDKSC